MKQQGVRWQVAGERYACRGTWCVCSWQGFSTLEAARGALAGGKRALCMLRQGVCWRVLEGRYA